MLTETIRSRATEGKTLSLAEYRSVAIPVFVSLTTSPSSKVTQYRVPMNDFLVVRRILPHLAIPAPSGETLVPAGADNMSRPNSTFLMNRDHIFTKAMNARLDLRVVDDDYTLFTNRTITVASLMQGALGEQLDYRDTPLRIRPGKTLQLTVTLNDASADAVGSATEYGIVLVGGLVRANPNKIESR